MGYKVVEHGKSRQVKSVWLVERVLILHWYLLALFVVVEIGLYVWKNENLPFAPGILVQELVMLALVSLTELSRISMGRMANIMEAKGAAIAFVVYTVLCGVGIAYFAVWQSYVLRIEFLLCIAYLVMLVLQLVLIIIGIVVYRS